MRQLLRFSKEEYKPFFCSVLLCIYMLLNFYFYFSTSKPLVTMVLFILPVVALIVSRIKKWRIALNLNPIIFFSGLFLLALITQVLNGTFNPRILYLITCPCLAYFIYDNNFHVKIIYLPLIIEWAILAYFVAIGKDFQDIFDNTSRNYVSVILIIHVIIVTIIEWRQNGKIVVWPALICFYFALLAIGRSGIICSLLLLLGTLYFSFNQKSRKTKIIYISLIIVPIVMYAAINFNILYKVFSNLPVLERFSSMGMKKDARDKLLGVYLNNMNLHNIFLGYNFNYDSLFIRYKLNPHNSFIFLHFNTGFMFFFIMAAVFRTSIVLLFRNKFLLMLMMVLLLRSWTDSFLFLGPYDFLFVLFYLISKHPKYVE